MRRTAAMLAALTMAMAGAPGVALAADPDFCRDYARAAISQLRYVQARPQCVKGAQGPRWADNERAHYEWCLTVPYHQAQDERTARQTYMAACKSG